MIRLRIDSVVCEPAAEQPLTLAWSGDALTDPEAGRSGAALTFELLSTPETDALFGAECHLYGTGRFNAALHKGELLAGGASLLSGTVRLVGTRWHGAECRYCVELRGGGHGWARQAAKRWFRELAVPFAGRLLPTEIVAGWSSDAPVRFLPVVRDRYEIASGEAGLQAPERLLATDDYHPFLSLHALVQALFAEAGYTVESCLPREPVVPLAPHERGLRLARHPRPAAEDGISGAPQGRPHRHGQCAGTGRGQPLRDASHGGQSRRRLRAARG